MKPDLVLKLLVSLSVTSIVASDSEESIPVCPSTHDRAFDDGRKCCSYSQEFKAAGKVAPRESNECPSNDSVDCPQGEDCEDSPPSCFAFFELEGFGSGYDGFYNSDRTNQYAASKQLYVIEPEFEVQGDKCVWWFRPCRRWWLGDCEHVGTNQGFAYIDADVPCPHPEEERWKNPESGEFFYNIHNYSADRCKYFPDGTAVCGAGFSAPLETSATAGVSAVVQDGTFKQACKWRYLRKQWRCV